MFAWTYLALFLAISPVLAGPVGRRAKGKGHHHNNGSDAPSKPNDESIYTEWENSGITWTWSEPEEPTSIGDEDGPTPTSIDDGPEITETDTSNPPSSTACSGNCYQESKSWVGSSFLDDQDGWEFFHRDDPTHGRVTYVDREQAAKRNLTFVRDNSFIMRADSTTTLGSGGPGRDSVRINTKKKYTTFASVFDVKHMPEGAGTWPALWTVGENWPRGGEIDIIEGVNDQSYNLISLHTSAGCTQPSTGRVMSGNIGNHDCNANSAKGNQGCGVSSTNDQSFGPNFNQNGGGWYAIEKTSNKIKVWFWPRDAKNVPADVRDNNGNVGPSNWGTPTASFVSDSCDLNNKFGPNKLVINLTLCGDWAGNSFDGGKKKCEDHVNKNPEAFRNAYWDINRISVYEK